MTPAPKDRDSARQTQIMVIGAYSCVSLIMGGFLGIFLFDWPLSLGYVVLGIPLTGVTFLIAHGIVEVTGVGAAVLYHPGRRSTDEVRRYSRIEAMAVRGETDRAIQAYREAYSTNLSDPEPLLRIAHLTVKDPERREVALGCLRQAAAIPDLPEKTHMYVLRELIERVDEIGTPERAAPILARTAQLHAGTRIGWWAAQELRALKERRILRA